MHKNKEAYNAAYQRAFEGKSSHAVWNFFNSTFEDEYTRESREAGARDGAAARLAAAGAPAEQEAVGAK
jgi:hypothetical protein